MATAAHGAVSTIAPAGGFAFFLIFNEFYSNGNYYRQQAKRYYDCSGIILQKIQKHKAYPPWFNYSCFKLPCFKGVGFFIFLKKEHINHKA